MNLQDLLSEKKAVIIQGWFDRILDAYPPDTSNFLRKQENRFANPVGHALAQGTEEIFNELLGEFDPERISPFLDNIVRIRAVQDFTASQSVSFILPLKRVIREVLGAEISGVSPEELSGLDSKIDEMTLLAFDLFMGCREKLYDIRANEMKKMTYRLLERANKADEGPGLTGSTIDNVKQKEVTK